MSNQVLERRKGPNERVGSPLMISDSLEKHFEGWSNERYPLDGVGDRWPTETVNRGIRSLKSSQRVELCKALFGGFEGLN